MLWLFLFLLELLKGPQQTFEVLYLAAKHVELLLRALKRATSRRTDWRTSAGALALAH